MEREKLQYKKLETQIKKEQEESQRQQAEIRKKLNYAKLPEGVKSAIQPLDYKLEIETKITWDGRQFIVRIPAEITEGYKITKQNRMLFKFTKFSPLSKEKQEKPKLEIIVI